MARGTPAPARPLHLLSYDESTSRFELGAEALAALRAVKGPVGVLSVCGRARQGKSFILNQLAGACGDGGFEVGPTVRPCTKGLWIWSAPIPRTTPGGEPYHLVLLDTEGIDAYDQTGQYSTQIFSLAVLLSSLFVYNQMGGIDEAALDRLSLVTEMTKHIRVRAGGDTGGSQTSDSSDALARFAPSFVWLLRDFYLDLEDGDAAITPAQYLESALRNVPNTTPSAEAKNQIRDSIRGLFPERECFPLVRPVNDEASLRRLDRVPSERLRPEFRDGLAALVNMLHARCRPKTVGSDVLNGAALAGMAETYVAAINGGAVPTIATAWQSVAEAECRAAAEAAEAAYASAFYERADALGDASTSAALADVHANATKIAKAAFDERAVGGAGPRGASWARLEAAIERRRSEYSARRAAEASAKCAELLASASQRVHRAANAPEATPESVMRAIAREADQFAVAAPAIDGAAKHEALARFALEAAEFALVAVATRAAEKSALEAKAAKEAEARHAARCAELEARAREAEARLKEECEERKSAEARVKERDAALADAMAATREAEARASLAAASATSEAMAARRERGAMESSLREALETEKRRAEASAERANRLEREVADARKDSAASRSGQNARVADLERALRDARDEVLAESRRRELAESDARDAGAKAAAADAETRSVAAGRVAAAEAAAASASKRAAESEARFRAAESRLAELKRNLERKNRVPPEKETDDDGGADVLADAELERWRAEAEAAAAAAAGRDAAARTSASPAKRRRPPPEEAEEEDPEAFVDAEEGGDDGAGAEEADAADESAADANARAEAEGMTVNQLKHRLQVMGLAHLYAGKRGVKKANLVDMFVNKA
jgi:hypothetical protein